MDINVKQKLLIKKIQVVEGCSRYDLDCCSCSGYTGFQEGVEYNSIDEFLDTLTESMEPCPIIYEQSIPVSFHSRIIFSLENENYFSLTITSYHYCLVIFPLTKDQISHIENFINQFNKQNHPEVLQQIESNFYLN